MWILHNEINTFVKIVQKILKKIRFFVQNADFKFCHFTQFWEQIIIDLCAKCWKFFLEELPNFGNNGQLCCVSNFWFLNCWLINNYKGNCLQIKDWSVNCFKSNCLQVNLFRKNYQKMFVQNDEKNILDSYWLLQIGSVR